MAYNTEDKEKIFNSIFETIENGKSLRFALSEIPLSSKTFYEWIENDEEKVKQYARVTELRAEALLDEMFDIVDDTSRDLKVTEQGEIPNNEVIQRSRLRYDARKWLVSKLNPKKYGDKTIHSGDEDNPIQTKTTIINLGSGIKPEK
jgi:hypothetical protein